MLRLKGLSQRLVFTLVMTIAATSLGGLIVLSKLHWQSDFITDLLKTFFVIGVGTAVTSFVFWTLVVRSNPNIIRGASAGLLTALAVIPIPAFSWTFKTEFFQSYQEAQLGFLVSISDAIWPAVKSGLYTFEDITKASLVAIIASIFVGFAVVKWIPACHRES